MYCTGKVVKFGKDLWKTHKLNPKSPQTRELLHLELSIKEKMGEFVNPLLVLEPQDHYGIMKELFEFMEVMQMIGLKNPVQKLYKIK